MTLDIFMRIRIPAQEPLRAPSRPAADILSDILFNFSFGHRWATGSRVECNLPKVEVAGSIPVFRSNSTYVGLTGL